MKTQKTSWKKWLGGALLALAALSGRAQAGTTAYLNIDVTISGSKSVQVNGVVSSSDTTSVNWTTPNQTVVAPGTVTVQNNSGVLTEGWELSTNANSLPASGGSWALAASSSAVGAEQFALQAVFGSSNTVAAGCSGASWSNGTST